NNASRLCWDIVGGSFSPGALLQQYSCVTATPEHFRLHLVSPGVYNIIPGNSSGLCMGIVGASTAPGAQIHQRSCRGSANFKFLLLVTAPVPAPAPLAVATSSLPGATQGSSYGTVLEARGGVAPYSWSATGLPAGLSLNSGTGQIAGTPSTAGNYTVTASVRDSETSPASASRTFSLSIAGTTVSPVSIITTSLPAATAGSSYNTMLQASGGVTPFAWSIATGQLPLGLSWNASTGVICATASASGTY